LILSHHNEVDGNVLLIARLLVFLHQRNYHLSLLVHRKSEHRVVEPFVFRVQLSGNFFVLFRVLCLSWVRSTCSVTLPFGGDGILSPGGGEDLADVDLGEVLEPV